MVVYYIPNFQDDFYEENGITTLEKALEADRKAINEGEISLMELGPSDPSNDEELLYEWSIVEVDK